MQAVAVRPNTEYVVEAAARGSLVHLGITGGPSTWVPDAPQWTSLRTSFRTGPRTTIVELYVHGWYAQGSFSADSVTLRPAGDVGTPQRPATPTGVAVGATTSRTAGLSWRAVPGATGYRVYDAVAGWLVADTLSPRPAALAELSPGRTTQLQVTAYNAGGESERSAPVTVTTPADSASVPYATRSVEVTATPSPDSLWVAWEAVETASDGYRIYVDGELAARTAGPATRLTGLAPDHTYRITVTAINARGESPHSRPAFGTTSP